MKAESATSPRISENSAPEQGFDVLQLISEVRDLRESEQRARDMAGSYLQQLLEAEAKLAECQAKLDETSRLREEENRQQQIAVSASRTHYSTSSSSPLLVFRLKIFQRITELSSGH